MSERQNLGRLPEGVDLPDLLELQTQSFADFLQMDVPRTKRENVGLQEVFNEVFPIENTGGTHRLEFLHYTLGKPKYDLWESQRRGLT